MSNEKPADQLDDKELNDLLDSALEDFKKPEPEAKAETEAEQKDVAKGNESDGNSENLEDAWTRDFLRQAADQFEENLQNLILNGSEGDLGASFQKMAQTVANVMTEGGAADGDTVNTDFQSAITQALNDLSATTESLSNETELSDMLAQTSLDEGVGSILPLMQGMLQHLLSKEMLYPSLKELVSEKYPKWLEEKRETLSTSEVDRYNKQLGLIQKVCEELEKEKENDTEEVKKKRFDSIVTLMQEVQSCGQLPEDLVGEQSMPFQLDADGEPIIPAVLRGMESQQNCRLM